MDFVSVRLETDLLRESLVGAHRLLLLVRILHNFRLIIHALLLRDHRVGAGAGMHGDLTIWLLLHLGRHHPLVHLGRLSVLVLLNL